MTALILQYNWDWYNAISKMIDWDEAAIIFVHIIDKIILLNPFFFFCLILKNLQIVIQYILFEKQQGKINIVSNESPGLHKTRNMIVCTHPNFQANENKSFIITSKLSLFTDTVPNSHCHCP